MIAKNPDSGISIGGELLLGFGPTLLLVGLFWVLARRAQSGGRRMTVDVPLATHPLAPSTWSH